MPIEQLAKIKKGALDAHEIIPGLWQGSRPPRPARLKELGFDMVVFCAEEWQPIESYLGFNCVFAPNDDNFERMPTQTELNIALSAAKKVAQAVSEGKGVLVTCWQGWNRSGLVSALALHLLTGQDGPSCIASVQAARPNALGNPGFRKVLSKLKKKAVGSSRPPARR